MIRTFKLDPEVLRGLIDFCGANANELKKTDMWRILSVPSFFQNDATAFFFESKEKSVLVLARIDQAAQIKQLIKEHNPEEAIKRISQLEMSPSA